MTYLRHFIHGPSSNSHFDISDWSVLIFPYVSISLVTDTDTLDKHVCVLSLVNKVFIFKFRNRQRRTLPRLNLRDKSSLRATSETEMKLFLGQSCEKDQ